MEISPSLKARIQQRYITKNEHVIATVSDETLGEGTISSSTSLKTTRASSASLTPFVLYLPTVNLRKDQNPAFALACHLANQHKTPLIVCAVLLDDHSMPLSSPFCSINDQNEAFKQVTMTARRLAFLTEALSQCATEWSDHGAGVVIRIHKPNGGRMADHLTLSSRATAVVTDEPFVHPFLSFVHKIEKVCDRHSIPCYRVDGSTTVPPCSVLNKRPMKSSCDGNHIDNSIYYDGVPAKAWMWQKRTEHLRNDQIQAAMNGEFDAPELEFKIDIDDFFISHSASGENEETCTSDNGVMNSYTFPPHWRNAKNEAPNVRPWTVFELKNLSNIKQWAMQWPGSDSSVPPCTQTIGTTRAGMQRWNNWISERKGLIYYAKRRSDPLQPHASSRMSCYLNFGIVSIFRLVNEVKVAQNQKVCGADKFEEEIVKWREMSYAHSFSRGDYNTSNVVPRWAKRWLVERKQQSGCGRNYNLSCLASGNSGDESWDGMQQYLVNTGELHNNVRMTWGKMLVHWNHDNSSGKYDSVEYLMQILSYLNDRYALDGLSPPSYAGLLWCLGWSDKPDKNGGISVKRRYKVAGPKFQDAEEILMKDKVSGHEQTTIMRSFRVTSTKLKRNNDSKNNDTSRDKKSKKNTLHNYFLKSK